MAVLNKKKKEKLKILIIVLLIIILLIYLIIVLNKQKNVTSDTNLEKANIEYKEKIDKQNKEELSDKTEQQRMEFYCAEFFKLIDRENYKSAYDLLYSDYKDNYFPTLSSFKKYFEDYFPEEFGLTYDNIERLGDIYVLTINVSDIVNGSYGHNFTLYVVVKENALNDYVISFSRNSAVGEVE